MCIRDRFYTFEVTFQADGQTLKTITVDYGGRLSPDQFPPLPGREGCSAAWEVFDADDITRSITVHAVYTPLVSAISTGEAQPRLLAEGSFSPDAALLLEDWTPDAYLIPAGYSPVSYTHLDVDKRQGRARARRQSAGCRPPSGASPSG